MAERRGNECRTYDRFGVVQEPTDADLRGRDIVATSTERLRELEDRTDALERECALLAAVIDQMPAGVVIAQAPSGRLLQVNAHAARIVGGEIPVVDGLDEYSTFRGFRADGTELEPRDWPLARAVAGGEIVTAEVLQIERGDGTRRWVAASATPVADADERIVAAVAVFEDVTDRERTERVQREFVTNAAHELLTPLAAITSAVEVLQGGAKEDPAQRDRFLAHAERETARLGRLSRALLVLARAQMGAEAPREELIELAPLLGDVASGLHPAPEVSVSVDCPPDLALVSNRELAAQALANLGANAAKFTQAGSILFRARLARNRARRRGDRRHGSRRAGRGDRRRLRSLLPRERESRPGGRLRPRARNRTPGRRGARGHDRAAVAGGRGHDRRSRAAGRTARPAMTRILVVDDEPTIRESVTYALEQEGFEVYAVDDGETGLRAAREETFDAVVLDVMLPGLSGTEVCRRLRAESAVPIVMLTARTAEVDRVVGLELGADDYVAKPFAMRELVARIRAILRRRELDRGEDRALLRVGGLELDFRRHEVRVDGVRADLTPTEFKLLALLASDPERAWPRRDLMRHLWESEHVGDERAVDAHVVKLRRKIEGDPSHPRRLVTVRGVGYSLVAV